MFVNSQIKFRVGFNVYSDAVKSQSEKGSSGDLQIVIPYSEPEKPVERKILTRKVKVDCVPGVSTNPKCLQCSRR